MQRESNVIGFWNWISSHTTLKLYYKIAAQKGACDMC